MKIRHVIALSRPRTCFLSVFAFLMGIKISADCWYLGATFALLASYLVSCLANFHNSTTDRTEDSLFLAGRGNALDELGDSLIKKILIALVTTLAVLLCASSLINLALAPVGILLLLAYSQKPWRLKSRPILGAFVFSLVVVLPFLGASMMTPYWSVIKTQSLDFAYLLLLWFLLVAKFFIKNLPDYEADKKSGLATTATIFPSYKMAAIVAVSLEVLAYLAIIVYSIVTTRFGVEVVITVVTALICLIHPIRFIQSYDIIKLNNAMKWDMFCSTLFLSVWSIPLDAKEIFLPWGICVFAWLLSMLIPLDSREGQYIQEGK